MLSESEKDDVCIFQGVTVLNPGQSVIQYLDGDLCYTVQCLQEKDQNTGYNAMHFTMINCSQQCEANGGIVQTYNDGCCKTCKKEEKICQKMTIRTTIRKNDCISQSPINVASCDGKCPSATIFNVNIDSHLRFCKCCREIGTRILTVPLRCSGNGTEIISKQAIIFWFKMKFREGSCFSEVLSQSPSKADKIVRKGAQCVDCDQAKKPARIALMEWTELPKGEDPDYYILTYQQADAFSQKNVRNTSKLERKSVSTTVLLEENRKYDITIESLKNGQIISVKSFKTQPKLVQIIVPYVPYSNAEVLFVRMPNIGVFDGIYVTNRDPPSDVQVFGKEENTVNFSWKLPRGGFDMFQADFSNTVPGTTYSVSVSAVSSSAYSSSASKTVTTNVTSERVGSAGILLSWNAPLYPNGRILSYVVKYKEVCPWMQTAYTQVTTKPDNLEVLLTSLNPGTTYEIMVAAENSAGMGVFSNPFLFQTAESAPGKVVNLTVEALNSSAINLIWFLPRQPNGKITSFKISVKHARSGIVVKDVLVKVEDLLSGRLPECNDKSESFLWSTTTPSTTSGKSTILSQTTVVSSTEAPNQMSSVWSEPISFVVTNLRPYTTYLFEVSAVTTEAGYIDSAIVRTPESVPEDPPQNFAKSNITAKSFSVMWDPPTIVTGKFSYRVELYGPSGHVLDNSTKDHKFVFSNLVPFTTYDVYVGAETSAGVGPKSSLTVFTPADVPGSVSDLQLAEVEATYIKIIWRKPQQPNGIITQYRVKVHMQETLVTLENTILGDKNKYLIESLEPYTISKNIKPSSPPWNSMEADNDLYEGSAEMFSSIQTASPVIFTSVFGDNLPDINGAAELHSALGNQYNIDILAEELSYVIKGLTPFTDYTISVSAFTDVGEGPPSVLTVRTHEQDLNKYTEYTVEVSASTTMGEGIRSSPLRILTDEDAPSSPPLALSVKQLLGVTVKLSWKPPLEPNGIILYYTVYVWNEMLKRCVNVTETSLEFTDLEFNYEYSAYLTASTRFGDGNIKSDIITFRTSEGAPSDPPKDVTYRNLTSTSIMLFWSPPQKPNGNILYYSVYFKNNSGIFIQNFTNYGNDSNVSVSPFIVLDDLAKYSHYTLWITASTAFGDGNKTSEKIEVYTDQDIPEGFVENVVYQNISSSSVNVSWLPPSQPNGLVFFHVSLSLMQLGTSKILSFLTYNTSIIFDDLEKYTDYLLKITPATDKGSSEHHALSLHIRTDEDVPLAPPQDLTIINYTADSVWLKWNPSPQSNGVIMRYNFKIYQNNTEKLFFWLQSIHCNDWEAMECIEYEMNQYLYANFMDDWIEDTVYGLKKYRWYRFAIAASTNIGYGSSSPWISTQTLPGSPDGPPENVTVLATSPHSINVSWSEPTIITGPMSYLIDVTSVDNDNYKAQFLKTNEEVKVLEISCLKAFTRYSVVIIVFTGDVNAALLEGKASSPVIVSTFEAVPEDPPNNITFQKIPDEVTKFQVTFVPPSEPNGNIQVYQAMVYKEDDPAAIQIHNLSVIEKKDQSVTAMIEGLKGGHTYNVSVYAINGAGAGPKIQLKITMDIKEPPRPKKKPAPVYDANGALLVTATTITIRMPICYYSDDHGPIKKIQVLVVEAGAQHDGNVTKWYDAYFNRPRPYFTNEGFPNPPCIEGKEDLSGKEETYVIGADTTCLIPGSQDKICNGPLRPRKQYLFKFRATNIKGQFTDSDYSDPIETLGKTVIY
ncbi:hypothetical protein DUI87_12672 [Hirundo rustica rustica]|uniref:Protein-tyrosine-phosphatase n=1 Tax=Hirundo rustica rustica TaxID=333673 RepID=A0A3M0K9L6_HIRRU|nr:hypothetical protein DUI87_12672 [Hirundo rustica rustica]